MGALSPIMCRGIAVLVVASLLLGIAAAQEQNAEANNGTDLNKLTSSASVVYEHNDLLPDFSRDTLRFELILPFAGKRNYSARLRVPIASTDVAGDTDADLGDVAVQLTHVSGVTRQRGLVVQGELILDTAQRPELGTGKHMFKGSFIYARFLPQGIFAPAAVHSVSVGGDSGRADVNSTTLDIYYVPKLADPRTFVTLDPALTFDWENDKQFASLAATIGRSIGLAFGGVGQVFAKPTFFAGSERPGDWSIEVGYKVLGFW